VFVVRNRYPAAVINTHAARRFSPVFGFSWTPARPTSPDRGMPPWRVLLIEDHKPLVRRPLKQGPRREEGFAVDYLPHDGEEGDYKASHRRVRNVIIPRTSFHAAPGGRFCRFAAALAAAAASVRTVSPPHRPRQHRRQGSRASTSAPTTTTSNQGRLSWAKLLARPPRPSSAAATRSRILVLRIHDLEIDKPPPAPSTRGRARKSP